MNTKSAGAGPAHRSTSGGGGQTVDLLAQFRQLRQSVPMTQSELSRRTGVAQPLISRIDRGQANPTVSTLMRLVDALREEAADGDASGSPGRVAGSIFPVRPLQQNLPLLDPGLTWERFEEFCRDFVGRRPGVRRVSSYGRPGSKQRGIDFPADMESGDVWSFQCRQVKDFSVRQFRRTVEAAAFRSKRYVLLLACQAGTALRDAERATSNWEIWDVTDISRMVRQLSMQAQRTLVTAHFGSYVQAAFLGLTGPAALRVWGEHFAPYMRPGRLFHHRLNLVGRRAVLDDLLEFVAQQSTRVIVVSGRGGIGKTKLLQEFGAQHLIRYRDRTLLFSDEATPFDSDTLQDIPAEPATLVVDDAHRRDDLGVLLSFAARWPAPLKLALAIRPEGKDRLWSILSEAAIDTSEIKWLPSLIELSRPDGELLAKEALGPHLEQLSERLFSATWDCPLVTVVGAELLQQKQLLPELLERSDEFRRQVLSKFLDAQLGTIDGVDPEIAGPLLALVSAVQPIRPADVRFVEAASNFLYLKPDALARTLDSLEAGGLLLRRGYQLRIVPDVLADHLLHRASLTINNDSTGFIERVLETFAGVTFDRLLANVAELDWRIQATGGSATTLLDQMWDVFVKQYERASDAGQVALLRLIKDAAVYQPRRVLSLIEWSIGHPSKTMDDETASPIFKQTRADVVYLLAELASACAHGGYVRAGAEILWQLGRDDERQTNQFPNHPIRLLTELAGYDVGKPMYVSTQILEAAKCWLTDDWDEHVHTPLDVLDSLLTKIVVSRSSDGVSINLRPLTVNPVTTQHLRGQVLEILAHIVVGGTARQTLRAVQTLDGVLREPLPLLGLQITNEDKGVWLEEQKAALSILDTAMLTGKPLVQLAVAEAVSWTAVHSYSQELRDNARSIISKLPNTFEVRIADALTRPWGRSSDISSRDDIETVEQRRAKKMTDAADELAASKTSAAELLTSLNQAIDECNQSGVKVDAAYLVGLLSERHPALALEAARAIAAVPGHDLEFVFAQFLLGARRAEAATAVKIASRAIEGGSLTATRGVAYLYAYRVWRETNLPSDLELLRSLLRHVDVNVRAMAILGIQAIGDLEAAQRKMLALSAEVGDSANIGQALAAALNSQDSPLLSEMTDQELTKLVEKFELVQDLEDYHIRVLLREAARRVPDEVVGLLMRRIDSLETKGGFTAFRPVPHNWAGEPIWIGISETQRQELLRQVRDAAGIQAWPRHVVLPELYADLADTAWDSASAILEEWIQAGDEKKFSVAVSLFARAPNNFVFDRTDVVERTLLAAARLGDDASKVARGAFAGSARTGARNGRMLRPSIQDTELIRRAKEQAAKYSVGSPTWTFYDNLAADTQAMSDHILKVEEEMIAGPLPELPDDAS